jgi:hypothetical protein
MLSNLCANYFSQFFMQSCCFSERVGAEVIECACVIELPELKVHILFQILASLLLFFQLLNYLVTIVFACFSASVTLLPPGTRAHFLHTK